MHKCAIVQDILPLYADHAIGPETEEFIREHLKECENCRKYLRSVKRQSKSLSNLGAHASYRYSEIARQIRYRRVASAAMTAAAFLGGIVCFMLLDKDE